MPLILEPKAELTLSIEVDSIRMEKVRTMPIAEIAELLVQHGRQQVPLGTFFDVSGSAKDDETIIWRGDCSRVKRIGVEHSGGTIRVEGDAGNHIGAEMSGGRIEVTGDVSHFAGAEMTGGLLLIGGNTGHSLGAAYRGAKKGMRGGEIFVRGNAGDEVGHSMRRGFIAVQGNVGDAAGFKMLAGSLLLFGNSGAQLGAGMKRGSIVCFQSDSTTRLLPTFLPASTYRPLFLRFYLKRLQDEGWIITDDMFRLLFTRYCGDFVATARGEILLAMS
ncbi:Formyltransferase/hydrolase complex Fhc subunit C [Polystyrenella longa]|uniref:Formyltransferase/hydrolase complex Fhc subunit C n=1 Tax=Polystyrenella longa TaxID=2528007 RepID=A0A518CQB7_9PLAN|nr:formylmethanofuran dehydrogenase subunit C [Polystyrenella longa]QDU81394.1 Formyltransferase/hydrolase complex Fhc subunit C [Polystyrenella longa]